MVDKKTQGKKNRESGQRFELKVRKYLEKKGWIADRWTNNVEFNVVGYTGNDGDIPLISKEGTKLIPAKPKTLFIKGKRVIINMWTGFPDFIAYKNIDWKRKNLFYRDDLIGLVSINKEFTFSPHQAKAVIGIECKSNGYLTKEEKEKVRWLLDNNIFSQILIGKKGKRRGEIVFV